MYTKIGVYVCVYCMCVCEEGGGSLGLCSLLTPPPSKSSSAWFLPWSSALTAEPADDWRPTEPDSRYCPSAALTTHSAMQLTRWLGASVHPSCCRSVLAGFRWAGAERRFQTERSAAPESLTREEKQLQHWRLLVLSLEKSSGSVKEFWRVLTVSKTS